MSDSINNRNIGLDIVRTCAILFVLCVHFFYNSYFYSTPVIGRMMYFGVFLRMMFIICVPLFLLLTGYLQVNKEPNKEYYKKIISIITIYLVYSLLSILVRIVYFNENKSVVEWIASVLNFTADGYAWYINMYIGLFLISPFLNIIYKNLKTKRDKQWLIVIFLIVTSVPELLNRKLNGILFFPDYWISIYPITYYFIGSFIREYQPKVKKSLALLSLLSVTALGMWIEIRYANGGNFSTAVGYYASLLIVIEAVIFFVLFYDIDIKNKLLAKPITIISILSLDIYLVSYLTDRFVYRNLYNIQSPAMRLFIPVVVTTFAISFCIAYLRYKLTGLMKIFKSVSVIKTEKVEGKQHG